RAAKSCDRANQRKISLACSSCERENLTLVTARTKFPREEPMELLKLVALDRDDLEVVSTHLQDATLSVADVHWRPAEKRLVIRLARFDWAGSLCESACESAQFQRRRTALRFDRVNGIKCRNVNCKDRNAMLNLLAVEFDESDPPGGVVTLIFSD